MRFAVFFLLLISLAVILVSCSGPECGYSVKKHSCTAVESTTTVALDSESLESVSAKVVYRCGEADLYGWGYCYDPLSAPEEWRPGLWIVESTWLQFGDVDGDWLKLSSYLIFNVDEQGWPETGKTWDLPDDEIEAVFKLEVHDSTGNAVVSYDPVSCSVTSVATGPDVYTFAFDDIHLALSENNDQESLEKFELIRHIPSEITVTLFTGSCNVETFFECS